jgi:hypothetical protein
MQYDGNSDTYYDDGQPDQSAQDFAVMPDQGYPPAPDFAVQPMQPSPTSYDPSDPYEQYGPPVNPPPLRSYDPYAPVSPPPIPSYDPYAQYGTPVTPSGYDYGTPVTPSGYDPYAPVEAGRPIPSYDEFLAKYKADGQGYMAPMAPMLAPAMGQGMGGQRLSGPYGQGYMAPSAAPAAAGAINPQMLAHGISGLVSALSGMTGNRTPSGGSTPGYDGQQLPPRLVRP